MTDEKLIMKDRLGNPVSVGDRVVYATLSGRDSRLVMTTVAGCFVDQAGVQHPLFMLLGRVRSLEPSEFVKVSTEYLDPQSDCGSERSTHSHEKFWLSKPRFRERRYRFHTTSVGPC